MSKRSKEKTERSVENKESGELCENLTGFKTQNKNLWKSKGLRHFLFHRYQKKKVRIRERRRKKMRFEELKMDDAREVNGGMCIRMELPILVEPIRIGVVNLLFSKKN